MTTITFEGTCPRNHYVKQLPDGYDSLDWHNIGSVGKGYIEHNLEGGGYDTILAGREMGYTKALHDRSTDAWFSSAGTFTLQSGTFSSLVTNGVEVTFTAFKGTHTFTQTVTLNESGSVVHFDRDFRHVDKVEITTARYSYGYVGLENLKVTFDAAPLATHTDHPLAAVHHPVDHIHHPVDALLHPVEIAHMPVDAFRHPVDFHPQLADAMHHPFDSFGGLLA